MHATTAFNYFLSTAHLLIYNVSCPLEFVFEMSLCTVALPKRITFAMTLLYVPTPTHVVTHSNYNYSLHITQLCHLLSAILFLPIVFIMHSNYSLSITATNPVMSMIQLCPTSTLQWYHALNGNAQLPLSPHFSYILYPPNKRVFIIAYHVSWGVLDMLFRSFSIFFGDGLPNVCT